MGRKVAFGLVVVSMILTPGCPSLPNLIPIVGDFEIGQETFPRPAVVTQHGQDCAIAEGCTVAGSRKLLRFTFKTWNRSLVDLNVGSPADNPQWYEHSVCHGHKHLRDFNTFKLINCKDLSVKRGTKQAFCLIDLDPVDSWARVTPQFTNCNYDQGVSAGWADVYDKRLDCQWIDITGLADGEYVLEARTNANMLIPESSFGDNVTWTGLRIKGNTAQEIPVPCYPEDCNAFNPSNVKAQQFNGRWKVVDGNHWILDFGSDREDAEKARDIIKHYVMNRICFVGRPASDGQLMTYFKTRTGVPTGSFTGEDAIPFDPNNIGAQEVGGRWKVVDGSHYILDFGVSEANAKKAVFIIKQYNFRYICFVGRPNAEMLYFRK